MMKLHVNLLLAFVLLTSNLAFAEDLLTDIQRETRTDTVEEKLKLVQEAYSAGRFDVALSLAESLKDTIQCDKQLKYRPDALTIEIENPLQVSDLPAAWAKWAEGWQFVQPLQISESRGISRSQEPVDISLPLEIDQPCDLHREVRVAYFDTKNNSLREVASQVYDVHRKGSKLYCRVVFFADVSANAAADYLLFTGILRQSCPIIKQT